jgi:hypothetical protein
MTPLILFAVICVGLLSWILFSAWGHAQTYRVQRSSGGTMRRLLPILVVGVVAAGALSMFSSQRSPRVIPPSARVSMAKLPPRKLQQQAAESAVLAAATAGKKALDSEHNHGTTVQVSTPVAWSEAGFSDDAIREKGYAVRLQPKPGVAVQVRAKSNGAHFSREKAMSDAFEVARDGLEATLSDMSQPVHVVPTVGEIEREYLKRDSVADIFPSQEVKDEWKKHGLGENRQWVVIDVEVSDRQLRSLRAKERATDGGLVAGAAFVAFAALFGFLRLDAWTKGYLTTALAFTAAGVVGGAVALLALVR